MEILKRIKYHRLFILLSILAATIYILINIIVFFVNKCPLDKQKGLTKENIRGSIKTVIRVVKSNKKAVCELDSTSQLIKNISDKHNLDWKLAIAISRHETGHYTSRAFKELHNIGGNYGLRDGIYQLMKFETLESGIDFFIKNLKRNYIDMGIITIEDIQKKYAPLNVENDPNNLNKHWVSVVNNIYNSLENYEVE